MSKSCKVIFYTTDYLRQRMINQDFLKYFIYLLITFIYLLGIYLLGSLGTYKVIGYSNSSRVTKRSVSVEMQFF